jgi:DNA polymerase (family 10)
MKAKIAYSEVLPIAQELVDLLSDGCARLEIAGSLRRRRPEVGDIELVAIPRVQEETDLFGQVVHVRSALDELLTAIGVQVFATKSGPRFKQFPWRGMMVDLFVQLDPATWGVNFTIRTGSADFAKWLVTWQVNGGALPNDMYVRDARIWQRGIVLSTPEEADVFRLIGLAWIPPEERERGQWRRR